MLVNFFLNIINFINCYCILIFLLFKLLIDEIVISHFFVHKLFHKLKIKHNFIFYFFDNRFIINFFVVLVHPIFIFRNLFFQVLDCFKFGGSPTLFFNFVYNFIIHIFLHNHCLYFRVKSIQFGLQFYNLFFLLLYFFII